MQKYYLSCIIKELIIDIYNKNNNDNHLDNKKNNTYEYIIQSVDDIIAVHINFMKKNRIKIDNNMNKLPDLYWIPKMHKKIPKERYIAASNKCTTKLLSTIITQCLKLVTNQHRRWCSTIERTTGVNRMWIIDNSTKVLDAIQTYNENKNIKNIYSYDFSTLYTNIPHKDFKKQIKWVLDKAFNDNNRNKIYIDKYTYKAQWNERKNAYIINKAKLFKYISFLIDNIYIKVANNIYRQCIGIPMGTDCAPFLANLYLYALEWEYIDGISKKNIYLARKFSNCFRYIDDLLSFNNFKIIDKCKSKMYPKELVLNSENVSFDKCSFLDIDMNIINDKLHTNLYDKRDDFKFSINNYPRLSANVHDKRTHNIIISQLIRDSNVCSDVKDFIIKSRLLIIKLSRQSFNLDLLKSRFSLFYNKYYNLIEKYNYSKQSLIISIFP